MIKVRQNLRKVVVIAICLVSSATMFAQERTMQVKKNGAVVFSVAVSGNEKIVFQDPAGGTAPTSNDALVLQPIGGGDAVKILLDEIQEIMFSGSNLFVVPFIGSTTGYELDNVKFTFGTETVDIDDITVNTANIVAYYSILGMRLPQAPEKGFYIILYDNGTTKKIVKH